MKTFTCISTALVLGVSILSIGHAAVPSDVPTTVVKLAGVDTTQPAGQKELYRRVSLAAKIVCRSVDPSVSADSLVATPAYHQCIDQAVSGAVAQINRPDFADYVASQAAKVGHGMQLASR